MSWVGAGAWGGPDPNPRREADTSQPLKTEPQPGLEETVENVCVCVSMQTMRDGNQGNQQDVLSLNPQRSRLLGERRSPLLLPLR